MATTQSAHIPTEAFILLSISNTSLQILPGPPQSGTLDLECVSVAVPQPTSAGGDIDRDVYLVLHMNDIEIPIDPSRVIHLTTSDSGVRTYTFSATDFDPSELILTVPAPKPDSEAQALEDLETFESVLNQYADLRAYALNGVAPTLHVGKGPATPGFPEDLRGHLVLVNQDNGEVVGEFEDHFSINEDPELKKKGHEDDPVVIEVPEGNAMEMFVRTVPPEESDWITKSATVVSHAISSGTNLLLTTISSASSYYISHSPSLQASGSSSNPSAPPPRALVFLTSESTRKGLSGVHAVSGQAVQVSSKTISVIDGMIRRAMGRGGSKDKKTANTLLAPTSTAPHLSSRSRSPSPSPSTKLSPSPPAYSSSTNLSVDSKPALPPRRSTSPYGDTKSETSGPSKPVPPPLPPRTQSGHPINNPLPSLDPPARKDKLSTKDRLILSADLIWTTLDDSAKQILDVGTESLGAVVGHKYGPNAAHTSLMMAGTVRNVALVYIDMRGIGRKALLKRVGKEYVKGRAASGK